MKKTISVLFFLIALFLCSCSITKRKYLPGYSIVWPDNSRSTTHKTDAIKIAAFSSNDSNSAFILEEKEVSKQCKTSEIDNIAPLKSNHQQVKKNKSEYFVPPIKTITKDSTIQYHPTVNLKARTGLIIGALSWGIPISIFIIDLLSNTSFDVFFILGYVGVFSGLILAILAIVFSILAISEIKSSFPKYSGMGKAIAGLILGITAIFLAALVLLLIGI